MCEQDPKPSSSPKIVTTHRLGLRSDAERRKKGSPNELPPPIMRMIFLELFYPFQL